jgi:hypothetical protein
MLLYAGDSERKRMFSGAFTRFVFPIGTYPRSNGGSAARSRGSTGALDCKKPCSEHRHNCEIARSSHRQFDQAAKSQPEALRSGLLHFGRRFGVFTTVLKSEVNVSWRSPVRVGNVLTILKPRYPAYARFSHVGLFCAVSGGIWSCGQT